LRPRLGLRHHITLTSSGARRGGSPTDGAAWAMRSSPFVENRTPLCRVRPWSSMDQSSCGKTRRQVRALSAEAMARLRAIAGLIRSARQLIDA
jgi:hypothetical protein